MGKLFDELLRSCVAMLARKLAAVVDLQDNQRQRCELGAGAVRFDQQTVNVCSAAEQSGFLVRHGFIGEKR